MRNLSRCALFAGFLLSSVLMWGQSGTPEGALEEMIFTEKVDVFARHLPVKLLAVLAQQGASRRAEVLARYKARIRETVPLANVRKGADGKSWEIDHRDNSSSTLTLQHSFISGNDALLLLEANSKITRGDQHWERTMVFTVTMRQEEGDWRVIEYSRENTEKNFESDEFIGWIFPGKQNEAAAASQIRTIHSALAYYAATFPDVGFPASFKELATVGDDAPSPQHAGMLDSSFSQDKVIIDGFEFRYVKTAAGYRVTAAPVEFGKTGSRSFFSDESGTIRVTGENRNASENDEPLDGNANEQ